jgi:hypothetical protein
MAARIVDGYKIAGVYEAEIEYGNGISLRSGAYWCALEAGKVITTSRVIIVR